MNNLRFATILHILTLLNTSKNQWLSSEWIAGSINVNAVIVRKELALLSKNNFVETRKGKEGGYQLKMEAKNVLLSDLIRLILEDGTFINKKNKPNPECFIGKQMNKNLDQLYADINYRIYEFLEQKTLADFYQSFKK